MKQLLFLVLALLSVSMAMAQKQPERKDFTIKIKKLTGAQGEVTSVVVDAYVGNKLYFEKAYEMDPPIDADLAGNMGSISEEDLNFDGYPDVDIYLGYMGGFANNTYTRHCSGIRRYTTSKRPKTIISENPQSYPRKSISIMCSVPDPIIASLPTTVGMGANSCSISPTPGPSKATIM